MATNGNTLITELSRRLRDPNNERHARTLVRDILTQTQRVINLHAADKIATASFTPASGRTLYQNTAIAADVAKIIAVRQHNRDLHEVRLRELAGTDIHWLRAQGTRHDLFARIGGSLFVLYPALERPSAISVAYITVPADVTDAATATDLSEEYEPVWLDLAEMVLSARMRLWSAIPELLKRVQTNMAEVSFLERGGA